MPLLPPDLRGLGDPSLAHAGYPESVDRVLLTARLMSSSKGTRGRASQSLDAAPRLKSSRPVTAHIDMSSARNSP